MSTTGQIETGSPTTFERVLSPDGRYVVISSGEPGPAQDNSARLAIVVKDSNDDATVVRGSVPAGNYVRGVAWSPDSKAVAILLLTQHFAFSPLGLLSAAAGHPIYQTSFGFMILNLSERKSIGALRFPGTYVSPWWTFAWKDLPR